MGGWASLGGLGNVDMRVPMPVGKVPAGGVLGMVVQALMQGASMRKPQQQEYDPAAEEEMARLLGLIPQSGEPVDQRWASLGMMGHR